MSALDNAPALVSSLTARVVELEDRIARRDELINDLISSNEQLLREIAEAEFWANERNEVAEVLVP